MRSTRWRRGSPVNVCRGCRQRTRTPCSKRGLSRWIEPRPLAVHSSGLGSIHLLKPLFEQGVRVLCLHPLQTFTGEPRAELLRDVPCAVTAHAERDLQLGEELARRLADDKKTLYHLSAVVGCNLLVALESEAKRLMDEATGGEDGLVHEALIHI